MIEKPKLSNYIELESINKQETYRISDKRFENERLEEKIEDGEFTGVDCDHIGFQEHLKNMHLIHSRFDSCEMTQLRFKNKSFSRVQFKNCKLSGLHLDNIQIKHASFEDCDLSYASFVGCSLDQVSFKNCNMKEIYLERAKLKHTFFESCDFTGSELYQTSFAGVDLSTCNLSDIRATILDFKGSSLNTEQALSLLQFLKITIV